MQTHCRKPGFAFQDLGSRSVVTAFDGGTITSDAGALPMTESGPNLKLYDAQHALIQFGRYHELFDGKAGHVSRWCVNAYRREAGAALVEAVDQVGLEADTAGEFVRTPIGVENTVPTLPVCDRFVNSPAVSAAPERHGRRLRSLGK